MAGKAKPKQIFSFADGQINVFYGSSQFILQKGDDENSRTYWSTPEAVFQKIMKVHIGMLSEGELNGIKEMRKVLKRAWSECKGLADAIREESKLVKSAKSS